ncbi:MAG: hypothetical protein FWD23_17515, partial [Oscillospiraceae bacterium]|nr:hypothetical protein [Oscillospiraceae bacterium]
MIKNDLRKQGYSVTEHYQNHVLIGIITVIFTLLLIRVTIVGADFVIQDILRLELSEMEAYNSMNIFTYLFNSLIGYTVGFGFMFILILFYFMYLGLK